MTNDQATGTPPAEPEAPQVDRTAVVAGILFMVLGALFWADSVSGFDVELSYLWPLLLIGLGLAGLLSTRRESR